MSKIIKFLKDLVSGIHFTKDEMYEFCELFAHAPAVQQSAILTLFSSKGETVEELIGALNYLLEQAVKFDYPHDIIDIVGTGGNRVNSFNISTAASLVIASCGVKIAKHGGRSSTGSSGSMDVLEELHIPIYNEVDKIYSSLNTNNYAVLLAPFFHPLFKSTSPVRKELGIPTMFNILGPIANPMRPKRQVTGVYRKDLVLKIAQVLQQMGSIHAMVVHSRDGLDEFSISDATYVAELKNGIIYEYEVMPEEVGLKRATLKDIQGGDPKYNAKLILDILSGQETGPPLDIVLFNAAAGLVIGERVKNLSEGVVMARDAIASGKTMNIFQQIIRNKL